MKHLWILLVAVCFVSVGAAGFGNAGDSPIPPRYQPLEKIPGVRLLRAIGSGELPALFAHASAISADGKTAAYVDFQLADDKVRDSRLLIWDIPAGRFRKEILLAGQQVTALAVTADGSSVLLGTMAEEAKKTVHVVSQWDAASGKRKLQLGAHKNPITALALSPRGDQVLSASFQEIRGWDLHQGKAFRSWTWDEKNPTLDIFAIAFFPDGKRALCGLNHRLRVLDLTEADPKKGLQGTLDLDGHTDIILSIAISDDGKTAVSCARDDTVRSWDLTKGKPLHVLQKSTPQANSWISLGMSESGKSVLSLWSNGDSDTGAAILSLWDATTGKERWSRSGNYRGIVPIRIHGTQALVGGGCNVLTQWDLAQGTIERTWGGPKAPITAIRIDAQGRLYAASQDGHVHLWDKNQLIRSIPAHAEPILALELNPKGTHLYTASSDKTVKIWDVVAGKLLETLTGHAGAVTALVLSRDGKRAYTGSSDRSIKVWDLGTGKAIATLTGHAEGINAVALSPDETWIASGSDDATIRLWPLRDGKFDAFRDAMVLEQHDKPVTCLAFAADSKVLVSGSQDQTLKIWDWRKGRLRRSIPAHKNWITSLFLVESSTAVTTGDDLTLARWDLDNGKEMGRVDFGIIGDCPRCACPDTFAGTSAGTAVPGPERLLVGTSSWMIFELEWANRKSKSPPVSSKE